jgi:hypothetical protein
MVSSDGGNTMLALFEGEPQGKANAGYRRVAFRVSGLAFLEFLKHIRSFPVFREDGVEIRELGIVDHHKSFSVYFCDPYGNRFEVTTYDRDPVRQTAERTA